MDAGIDLGLRGRNALVTGGSRGVGRSTALLLASAGANVGIGYRSRAADADEVVTEIESRGVAGWAHGAELADAEGVASLFDRCAAEWPELDVVVCNHGIWPPRDVPIAGMSPQQWERTLAVNLTSVFHIVRAAANVLRDDGRIVIVSSTAGQRGEAYHADYAATKGAVISLVKGVAVELGGRGITVNCVAPGWIDTEMVAPVFVDDARRRIEAGIPIGRVASAEDVAGPIVFLCSALARHITGEVLNVNGGSVLCG